MIQIFTVSELNQRIKERVETDLRLQDLWARGELSNVVNHRSGHRYFTLKDMDSQLSCALFRNHGAGLEFELKDGLNVLVFGDIELYRPRGHIQLVVRGIKLDFGLGMRHRELEMLKKKLDAEGLFDLEHKRAIPRHPSSIGIVTSPDGAALRDVLSIIGSYPAKIVISPAQVQGEGAPESLAGAIAALAGIVDVIIVCRGGGSAEDLWSFNHELIARAIFDCNSPVISAIGHETDFTIADFVADVRAATPTAAAKMVVPEISDILNELRMHESRMTKALWSILERRRDRLEYIQRSFSDRKMQALVAEQRQRLDYLADSIDSAHRSKAEMLRNRLALAKSRLESVSPLATLHRGYAIAISADGGLISRAEHARLEEMIEIILADGKIICKVIDKKLS